jgi:hypothetical protein
MKEKFKYILILSIIFWSVNGALAQPATRKFSKSWPAADIETLEIINKFGEVKILNTTGNQISVEVVVTAEGSEKRAKSVLDEISVNFGKFGSVAKAETKMASGFKSSNTFSIDYTVNIPEDKNLNITNKFGNVVLQNLSGKGVFDVGYGNLTAGQLHATGSDGISIVISYGKADIGSMLDAKISLAYSRMYLKSAGNIKLESKYSNLSIDMLSAVSVNSKYDTFSFGSLNILEGESRFTNYMVKELHTRLKLVSGYGSIKVDRIPAGFELIDVSSSFAQVTLGIEKGAAYQVNAVCDFCTLEYPTEMYDGNRMTENTRQTVDGRIAGGGNSVVKVKSRYGNIRLKK